MKTGMKVGLGVLAGTFALFGLSAYANAASKPKDPNDPKNPDNPNGDHQLALKANAAFATAMAAAAAVLTAAGASAAGVGAIAGAAIAGVNTAASTAAWNMLSEHDKAEIWRGGGPDAVKAFAAASKAVPGAPTTPAPPKPSSAGGPADYGPPAPATAGLNGLRGAPTTNGYLADFGFTLSTKMLGVKGGKLPGCTNPAPGFNSLVCWIAQGMADNMAKMGQTLCTNADSAVASLKARGVPVPGNWGALTCDQKMAFLLAMASPLGIGLAVLLGSAAVLGSVLKSKQVAQLTSAVSGAAKSVGGAVASGMKAAEDAAAGAAKNVSNVLTGKKKLFGLDGIAPSAMGACACTVMTRQPMAARRGGLGDLPQMSTQAPLPTANLPGSSFISPAGMVPTVATANSWTRGPGIPEAVDRSPDPMTPLLVRFNSDIKATIPKVWG